MPFRTRSPTAVASADRGRLGSDLRTSSRGRLASAQPTRVAHPTAMSQNRREAERAGPLVDAIVTTLLARGCLGQRPQLLADLGLHDAEAVTRERLGHHRADGRVVLDH